MKEIKDITEKYIMFLDCKNQYCENNYNTKQSTDLMQSLSNYQWHFSQNKNFYNPYETQKTSNNQSNPKKEKQIWRNQAP